MHQLLEELSTKIKDMEKYRARSASSEMVEIFEHLTKYIVRYYLETFIDSVIHRKLEEISNKARPLQCRNWKQQMLNQVQNIVKADEISETINGYFMNLYDAFSDCEVGVLTCNTFG